jgi:hypothetical protein
METSKPKNHKITGKKISQKDFELNGMIKTIVDNGCTSYLEIGAREGNTFYDVMTSLPKGSLGVAVDLPAGTWGKSGTEKSLEHVCNILREMGYQIYMILGDSTDPNIINEIEKHGKYDACLIDGDHRLLGCTKDWMNYSPMVNKVVAFHDIDGHEVRQKSNPELIVEVPILWEKLKQENNHLEFIDRNDQPERPMGIGIILL